MILGYKIGDTIYSPDDVVILSDDRVEKTHNYKEVNASTLHKTITEAANHWANRGWRVVGVVSDTRPGYAHSLILERPVGVSHPDD